MGSPRKALRTGHHWRWLALASLLGFLAASISWSGLPAAADGPRGQSFSADRGYRADFSRGESRGVGFRFEKEGTSLFVDARLRGVGGQEASRQGERWRYDPPGSMRVEYSDHGSWVKEDIILEALPASNRFAFDLRYAPELRLREVDGGLEFVTMAGEVQFAIPRPFAYDRAGRVGSAWLELIDAGRLDLVVEQVFLDEASYPVTVDPTFQGASSLGSTDGRSVVTRGNRAMMVWKGTCNGITNSVCWVGGAWDAVQGGWQWGNESVLSSAGMVHDLWMHTPTEIFAVGVNTLGTTGLYWYVQYNGSSWSWGSAKTVATIGANSTIRLSVTASTNQGALRVWIAYRGIVGLGEKQRISYGGATGTSWTHKTVMDAHFGNAQILPRGPDIIYLYREHIGPEVYRVPISWSGSIGASEAFIEGSVTNAYVHSFRATIDRSSGSSSDYHLAYALYDWDAGTYRLEYCAWEDLGDAACEDAVHEDIEANMSRTYDVAVDGGWVALAFIPRASAQQNPGALVIRARYEYQWSEEKVLASVANEVTLGRDASEETFHIAWLSSGNALKLQDFEIDLPAEIVDFAATPQSFSGTSPPGPVSFNTSDFLEEVSWVLRIEDAEGTLVKEYSQEVPSTAGVEVIWNGSDSDGYAHEGLYYGELEVVDSFGWVSDTAAAFILDLSRTYWDPDIAAEHVAACDNSMSHKASAVVEPEASLEVFLDLPQGVHAGGPVKMHYSVDGGSTLVLAADVGPTGRVDFTIPASQLSEGTTLDYAFEIEISDASPDNPCFEVSYAVVPTQFSFHSFATDLPVEARDRMAEELWAVAQLGSGAGLSAGLSVDEVCSVYFTTPTPCDNYPYGWTDIHSVEDILLPPDQGQQPLAPAPDHCSGPYGFNWARLPPYNADNPNNTGSGTAGGVGGDRDYSTSDKKAWVQGAAAAAHGAEAYLRRYPVEVGQAANLIHPTWSQIVADIRLTYTIDGWLMGVLSDWALNAGSSYRANIKVWARTARLNSSGAPISNSIQSELVFEDTLYFKSELFDSYKVEAKFSSTGASFNSYDWKDFTINIGEFRGFYLRAEVTVEAQTNVGGYSYALADFFEEEEEQGGQYYGADWAITVGSVYMTCHTVS